MAVSSGGEKSTNVSNGHTTWSDAAVMDSDETKPLLPVAVGESRLCGSVRLTTSFLACLGMATSTASRVNLSVAMTAMANSSYSTTRDTVNTSAEICPAPEVGNSTDQQNKQQGEFPWDSHTQELILAAFFYGMVAFQLPFGVLVDKVPRACPWVIGVGYALSAVCNLLVPVSAYAASVAPLVVVRTLAGVAESGAYPAIYSLMSRWSPLEDRSKLLAIVFAGASMGQIIAQPVSGFLSDTDILGGWPSTFYLFGALGLVWFIFWTFLVYDTPLSHPRISYAEREHIVTKLNLRKKIRKVYPWKHFLTDPAMLAVSLADFSLLWVFYAVMSNLPIFLKEVLRFEISEVGVIASIPQITLLVFIMVGGYLADFLLSLNRFSLTAVRKFMTTIGIVPSGLFLVAAGYGGCNAPVVIACISLGLGSSGLAYSGSSLSMMEFAAPYAGMVVAIANACATLSGFLSPLVLGVFTANQADIRGWRRFFWLTFGIGMLGWTLFMVLGTSELRDWARPEHEEEDDDNDNTKVDMERDLRASKTRHEKF